MLLVMVVLRDLHSLHGDALPTMPVMRDTNANTNTDTDPGPKEVLMCGTLLLFRGVRGGVQGDEVRRVVQRDPPVGVRHVVRRDPVLWRV